MGRLLDMFVHKYNYTDFHELNLDWLILATKELLKEVDSLDEWKSEHEKEYEELKALYDGLVAGEFPDGMEEALKQWVIDNSESIIGELIKHVFFNLNDEGYFVAYIPDSWSDIIFGTTGLDIFPVGVDYGHLTLNY